MLLHDFGKPGQRMHNLIKNEWISLSESMVPRLVLKTSSFTCGWYLIVSEVDDELES